MWTGGGGIEHMPWHMATFLVLPLVLVLVLVPPEAGPFILVSFLSQSFARQWGKILKQ